MKSNNLTYFYGPTGSGKTTMLKKLSACLQRFPETRVVKLGAEQLVDELQSHIRLNDIIKFDQKYHSCDVLMVDNIWILLKRPHATLELFRLFQSMLNNSAFVILAGDIALSSIGLRSSLVSDLMSKSNVVNVG